MTESTSEYKKRIEEIKQSIENEPYMAKMREDIAEGISKTGIRQATVEEQFQSVQDHYEATVQEKFQNIDDQFQAVVENTTGKDVISAPEIILARNGEADLKTRLDKEKQEVTAQLAQTTNLAGDSHSKNTIITPKLPTGKGFIVITDDDGGVEILDKLLPLSTDYNIPITLGAVVRFSTEQTDKYLTKEQLKDLQDTHGWEIASHSMTHAALHGATRETAEYEMGESRKVLGSWGLDIKNYIAPFGQIIEPMLQEVASKYYNTASTTGGGPHYRPIMNHQVRRVPLGSFYEENEGTLEFYKSKVDEAFENDGLLVWMTHAWDEQHNATQDSNIRGMIEYAQSLGIPFGNMQEGFERYGNMLEIRNRRQIGNDGKMFGFLREASWIVTTPGSQNDDVMFSTTPKHLSTVHGNKVLKTRFGSGLHQPFPENKAGTLVTYLTGHPGDAFQQWHPDNAPHKVYYRQAKSETEWNEFKLVGEPHLIFQSTYMDGAILVDTTPDEIASFHGNRIVKVNIGNADNQTFPESTMGTFITYSANYFGDVWQKWHPYQKPHRVYYRHALTDGTGWSSFKRSDEA